MVANGSLYQHTDGHDKGYHDAADAAGNILRVSSTHHQQMMPGAHAEVILKAKESTFWKADDWGWELQKNQENNWEDIEAIYYPEENMLCFQPHPELDEPENKACQDFFFDALEEYFLTKKQIEALQEFLNKKKAA